MRNDIAHGERQLKVDGHQISLTLQVATNAADELG